jgi:hypothetical protein
MGAAGPAEGVLPLAPLSEVNEIAAWRWFTPAKVKTLLKQNAIRAGLSLTALLWALAV